MIWWRAALWNWKEFMRRASFWNNFANSIMPRLSLIITPRKPKISPVSKVSRYPPPLHFVFTFLRRSATIFDNGKDHSGTGNTSSISNSFIFGHREESNRDHQTDGIPIEIPLPGAPSSGFGRTKSSSCCGMFTSRKASLLTLFQWSLVRSFITWRACPR